MTPRQRTGLAFGIVILAWCFLVAALAPGCDPIEPPPPHELEVTASVLQMEPWEPPPRPITMTDVFVGGALCAAIGHFLAELVRAWDRRQRGPWGD